MWLFGKSRFSQNSYFVFNGFFFALGEQNNSTIFCMTQNSGLININYLFVCIEPNGEQM